jgi:hypothetical protein
MSSFENWSNQRSLASDEMQTNQASAQHGKGTAGIHSKQKREALVAPRDQLGSVALPSHPVLTTHPSEKRCGSATRETQQKRPAGVARVGDCIHLSTACVNMTMACRPASSFARDGDKKNMFFTVCSSGTAVPVSFQERAPAGAGWRTGERGEAKQDEFLVYCTAFYRRFPHGQDL